MARTPLLACLLLTVFVAVPAASAGHSEPECFMSTIADPPPEHTVCAVTNPVVAFADAVWAAADDYVDDAEDFVGDTQDFLVALERAVRQAVICTVTDTQESMDCGL